MRPRTIPAMLVRGHEVALPDGETFIGRSPDCLIAIVGPLVSRKHARIVSEAGIARIEDLGSRNGVFVNGIRIDEATSLQEGDTVLIGTTELAFFFAQLDESTSFDPMVFDEQGNVVSGKGPGGIDDASTLVHFEADEDTLVRPDREETTAEGRAPPPSAALPVRPQEPSTLPSMGVVPRKPPASRQLPKLAPAVNPTPPPDTQPRSSPRPAQAITESLPATAGALSGPPPSSEPLSTVFEVFDRMLARGDLDAAGRALAGQLAKRLEGGRAKTLNGVSLEGAASRCLILAERTAQPAWVHNAIDLYRLARKAMSSSLLDRLVPLLGELECERSKIAAYQTAIRDILGDVSVDELSSCERILSL